MTEDILHSYKGTTWKTHKYLRKEGNKYFYRESGDNLKTRDQKKTNQQRVMDKGAKITDTLYLNRQAKLSTDLLINTMHPNMLKSVDNLVSSSLKMVNSLPLTTKIMQEKEFTKEVASKATEYSKVKELNDNTRSLINLGQNAIQRLFAKKGSTTSTKNKNNF